MAETSVLLNISDMIDLAIGTPEIGVVDFGMLQTVLHCLAQQLKVLGKNVELRGSIAKLPVGQENTQSITVTEYLVETEDETSAPKSPKEQEEHQEKDTLHGTPSVAKSQDTVLVVERKRRSDATKVGLSSTRVPSQLAPITVPPRQQVASTEKLSLVTISRFNILENTVKDLKDRVYGSMPKNEDILEEVRSQTNLKAITDMWTSLNVSSRLEAAETGLAKLSSLVQDLISDSSELKDQPSDIPTQVALQPPKPFPAPSKPAISESPTKLPPETLVTKTELKKLQTHLDRLRGDHDKLTNTLYNALADMQAGKEPTIPPPPPAVYEPAPPPRKPEPFSPPSKPAITESPTELPLETLAIKAELKQLGTDFDSLRDKLNNLTKTLYNALADMQAGKEPTIPSPPSAVYEPAPPPRKPEPFPPSSKPSITESPTELPLETLATKMELKKLEKHFDRLRRDHDKLTKTLYNALADMQAGKEPIIPPPPPAAREPEPFPAPSKPEISGSPIKLPHETLAIKAELKQLGTDFDSLRDKLNNLTKTLYNALADMQAGKEPIIPPPPPAVYESAPPPRKPEPFSPPSKLAITESTTELPLETLATKMELKKLETHFDRLRGDLNDLTNTLYSALEDMQAQLESTIPPSTPAVSEYAPLPPKPKPLPAPSKPAISESPAKLSPETLETKMELKKLHINLDRLRGDFNNLTNKLHGALADVHARLEPIITPPPPLQTLAVSEFVQKQVPPPQPQLSAHPQPQLPAPPLREPRQSQFPSQSFSATTGNLMERMNELERRINVCCERIGQNDGIIQDQMNSLQDQIEYLLKQVSALTGELASGKLSPDLIKDLQGLLKLFQTVQEMQEQLKLVHETALELAAEKEGRNYHMNALLEQIELLKTIKMDREDMEEAMADKADMRMLARKVSHDQFELACDDLSRGLENALGKLNLQEALWQQALDDIQREIEMKLDKMELSPVKDFFNSKLKQLQHNLKQMMALRREVEAAGTKRRLLREVNCISCDANAVMAMEAPPILPTSPPMPATISMKPYLSYELDTIRKGQATKVPQRNLHDWENMDKHMGQQKPIQKARSDTGKHLCNRYCGGSHTKTTPAQRVTRTGHFVKQWGPDVLPLSSALAAGDDGKFYRISSSKGANVGPGGAVESTYTPKYPKRGAYLKAQRKPSVDTEPECRCLEEDHLVK